LQTIFSDWTAESWRQRYRLCGG